MARIPGNSAQSGQEVVPEELTQSTNPVLRFIFLPHAIEYVDQAVRHLEDIDIVTHEHHANRRTTTELKMAYNALSQNKEPARLVTSHFKEHEEEGWIYEIARHFQGQGKRFRPIDAFLEGELKERKERHDRQRKVHDDVLLNRASPYDVVPFVLAASQTLSDLTIAREAIMAKNIDRVVSRNPDSRIAVLVGGAHTPLARRLETGLPLEKVFINLSPLAKFTMEYDAGSRVTRHMTFGTKPPESLVYRQILLDAMRLFVRRSPDPEAYVYGVNRLSPQEVEHFIDQMDRAAKKVGKDPRATFRYENAITQAAKLAAEKALQS